MANKEKLKSKAAEHLDAGEEVLVVVEGTYETKLFGQNTVKKGILLATDKKLVMYASRLTGFDLEVFPYENISSFESGKNFMGNHISFFASNNKVSIKWIQDKDFQKLVAEIRARMGTKQTLNVEPDIPEQIKKLADLKESGILTQEEFDNKKQELLAKM